MIVVRAWSGLFSRVRMLYDAYRLTKNYDKDKSLKIIWQVDKDCFIPYEQVFDDKQFSDIKVEVTNLFYHEELKNIPVCGNFTYKCEGKINKIISHHITKLCAGNIVSYKDDVPQIIDDDFSDYFEWKQQKWGKIHEIVKAGENCCIECYENFSCPWESKGMNKAILFGENYNRACDEIVSGVEKQNLIGVHIRRTDHIRAIKNSPTSLFVDRINEEINENSSVRFFLATDDEKTQNNIVSQFGDRIIVQTNKKWGRTSSEEMASGIIDSLCLTRCCKIYGSFTSQFSTFCAEYADIPLIILKK